MKNEVNIASAREFSENLSQCLKNPAYEIIIALEDIKTRASPSDQEKLE